MSADETQPEPTVEELKTALWFWRSAFYEVSGTIPGTEIPFDGARWEKIIHPPWRMTNKLLADFDSPKTFAELLVEYAR